MILSAQREFDRDLMMFAYSQADTREDAEDAFQEARVKCWMKRTTDRPLAFKIIKDCLNDKRRKRQRETTFSAREADLPIGWLAAPRAGGFTAEEFDALSDIVKKSGLPARMERVLLCRLHGYEVREIAQDLRLSVRTVTYAIAEGIKLVRERNPYAGLWFADFSRHVTKGEPVRSGDSLARARNKTRDLWPAS